MGRLAGEVGLQAPARPRWRGGCRRCARAARPGKSHDAGPSRLTGPAAAVAGAALSMGAVATGSSTRTWAPKVGKPGRLLQISERVASISHLLGVDSDKAAKRAKPLQWLDVVQQLTMIESRVEELQVVVDQAAAAEEGARSPAALVAAFAAEHQAAAASGAAQAPLAAPRPAAPRRFAAWRLPWGQAKPTLADWAEAKSASAREARLLRALAGGDDLEMGSFAIWAMAAPDIDVAPGVHATPPGPPQALVFASPTGDEPSLHHASEYAVPGDRLVVHYVLARPGEAREPVKAALRDWVESQAPKVVLFPDPDILEVQGLERLLAASSVDPLAGLLLYQ